MADTQRTLVDRLRFHAERHQDAAAMVWVPELSREPREALTFGSLLASSETIAAGLAALPWPADRPRMAMLAFPPGLDFIRAFLACFIAGVVAVPVALPRRGRAPEVLEAIAQNCAAPVALTSGTEHDRLQQLFAETPGLRHVTIHAVDALPADGGLIANAGASDLAFVQYTSGSSSRAKGVCVTHANLLANLALIERSFGFSPEHVVVNWLPHYHDMGLIGGLLLPVYYGIPTVSIAPSAFIKRPLRWLQLVSEYRDRPVTTGGPNFAYQLCVDRIADADCEALSLGHWGTAFNGAEPVRAATLEAFVGKFGRCGFGWSQFYPCYGLAETTLFATGTHAPATVAASVAQLEAGRVAPAAGQARALVSSGRADADRIAIVDAASRSRLPEGSVGEIWIAGPSVPQRYLNDAADTARTYGNTIADESATTRYLATGDLGAIVDGELYVTGRSKELLIVNGRNVYPHDIEALLDAADARVEAVAVFAWTDPNSGTETVVTFCELARQARSLLPASPKETPPSDLERLADILRIATAPAELVLNHVRFVGPMGIPTTSSGKTAYGQLRREFAALSPADRARATSAAARSGTPSDKEERHDGNAAQADLVR